MTNEECDREAVKPLAERSDRYLFECVQAVLDSVDDDETSEAWGEVVRRYEEVKGLWGPGVKLCGQQWGGGKGIHSCFLVAGHEGACSWPGK